MDGESTGRPPVERYRDNLVLLARVFLDPEFRCRMDPSDVAHEPMLRAFHAIHQYRGTTEAEWLAWLRTILRNTLMDQYRAFSGPVRDVNLEQSFERALERPSARLEEWLGDSSDSREAGVLREELLDQIARAISMLPEDQRTAFELHYFHGLLLDVTGQQMVRSKRAVAETAG
jgi:RNA polymerase sigma-70 factor (ECF subfamily)